MDNYSLSDIKAITDDNNGMAGGGNWLWIVVLFLLIGGGGFGGLNHASQGALTRAELNDGFNNQTVLHQIDDLGTGMAQGFYAANTTMLQGMHGINNNIDANRFAAQQCCCETNRNIDAVRFDNSKNTCDITSAIHAEGEATRALIQNNTMQTLRDQLCDAKAQNSQYVQNQYLLSQLGRFVTNPPCPICPCPCPEPPM